MVSLLPDLFAKVRCSHAGELEKLHKQIAVLEGEVTESKGTRPATPEERAELRKIADPAQRLEMARKMGLE